MTAMATAMEIQEIMKYLPHRYPFLLVDRVLEVHKGERIVAVKNVTINEPFFQGHFPHVPVMPGVLMLEAMAQTAAILSFVTLGIKPHEETLVYFAGIDNARFKKPVAPGDQLVIKVQATRKLKSVWKYSAACYVDDQLAAKADLMCALKGRVE